MDKQFKEYIKQGIGIWIGFLVASVSFALIITIVGGTVWFFGTLDERLLDVKINSAIKNVQKERDQANKEIEEQNKAEKKANSKILKNTASKEIIIVESGVCVFELLGGEGDVTVLNNQGQTRSEMWNVKIGDVKKVEVKAGEKIILPENASAVWGMRE